VRALACPASLKGVLSAFAAAKALRQGFVEAGASVDLLPVADGGEGTSEVLHAALGGEWRDVGVSDPLGRAVRARWLLLPDGRAVVEAAAAIGLPLLGSHELDPLRATSRGLGELIRAALAERPAGLLIGLGGVATVDGGAGLRSVLDRLPVETLVLCDVRTRLREAARLYGPQKGAGPDDVRELERRLAGMRELAPYAELPGSGAAGGLGAALAVLGATLVPGGPAVLDTVRFEQRARASDLVVTGEGTVDRTTAEGKAPGAVAERCRRLGVRCVVFGGRVVEPLAEVETVALSGDPERAWQDLVHLGRRLAAAWVAGC
jgi:glycerate kinase